MNMPFRILNPEPNKKDVRVDVVQDDEFVYVSVNGVQKWKILKTNIKEKEEVKNKEVAKDWRISEQVMLMMVFAGLIFANNSLMIIALCLLIK